MSLKGKALSGIIWTSVDKIGGILVGFILSILIARNLEPLDYGLMGMLTLFSGIASVILESGFGQALIRKQNPSNHVYSTVFYFNLFLGLLLYVVLYFFAPQIAKFYNSPELIPISRVVFLSIIFNAVGLIQNTIMQKNIAFKELTKINISTVTISGIIGLFAALSGLGVWALVIQILSISLLRSILLWSFNSWRPILVFNVPALKELFSFGSKLMLSGLVYQVSFNSYQVLIGKFYDITSVGIYTQANRLQQIPASNIDNVIQTVTFPVLAEIQNDDQRLKRAYKRILRQTVFFNFPIMVLFSVVAESFIAIFLTEKWLPSAPLLSLLCLAGIFYPVHTLNLNIIKIKGRSDIFLFLEVVKNILLISILFVTIKNGIVMVVTGQVLLSFLALILHMYLGGKLINLSIIEQFKEILPILFISSILGLTALLINLIQLSSFITMSLQIVYFVSSYLGIALLSKNNELNEIISLVKNRIYKHEAR